MIEVFVASFGAGVKCAIVAGRPIATPVRPIIVLHFHYWPGQSPLEVMSTAVKGLTDRAEPELNRMKLKFRIEISKIF